MEQNLEYTAPAWLIVLPYYFYQLFIYHKTYMIWKHMRTVVSLAHLSHSKRFLRMISQLGY